MLRRRSPRPLREHKNGSWWGVRENQHAGLTVPGKTPDHTEGCEKSHGKCASWLPRTVIPECFDNGQAPLARTPLGGGGPICALTTTDQATVPVTAVLWLDDESAA